MKDLPPPLDVIAVGAHPDDVEIGCGGTLALLAAQGHRVGIVDLTDGEPTPRSSGPAERLAEAAAAAKVASLVRGQIFFFHGKTVPVRLACSMWCSRIIGRCACSTSCCILMAKSRFFSSSTSCRK